MRRPLLIWPPATANFRASNSSERIRDLYTQSGAFAKAEQLLAKLRARALDAAGDFPTADLQELMRFLVRMVLPESTGREVSAR